MKMSDVFNLPLSTEKVYKRLGHAWGIDENKVEAITTAINNHDRLEQENAELREALQEMVEQFECDHNCEYEYKLIKASKQLLNK